MQLCIDQCIQACNLKMASGGDSSKPNWTSTNKRASNMNYGVTIRPGSEISIRAIGNILLGDQAANPDIYINAQSYMPGSFDINWSERALDVRGQQSLNIDFSGRMYDGSKDIGAGNLQISSAGNTLNDAKIFNGAKRLITYLIPHPAGYDFDVNSSSEKSGSINVPLLSDPLAWGCKFSGADELEATCESEDEGYKSLNYNNVDDSLAKKVFAISSSYQTSGLGTFGGMIRWSDLDLKDAEYDPFEIAGINCTSLPCNRSGVDSSQGTIVGDLTTQVIIGNPNPTEEIAYKVSFRSLDQTLNSSCNNVFLNQSNYIEYYVTDASGNPVHGYENSATGTTIAYPLQIGNTTTSWSNDHITLEPGHKIVINNVTLADPTCGGYIAARFIPYHEIEIHRSGLAKFAILDASTSSESCTLDARIINPEGSHSFAKFFSDNISNTTYEPDFYEYGSFTTNNKDPLQNLSINGSWSGEVFLRKGQKIRFSPNSWNGEFSTSAGNRKCGIAMAMHIRPKPALLCRGISSDQNPELVTNPSCSQDFATEEFTYTATNGDVITVKVGDLIGCRVDEPDCDDTTHANYCPAQCKAPIECSDYGNIDNNYLKSGCVAGDTPEIDAGDGTIITCDTPFYDYTTCSTSQLEAGDTSCRTLITYPGCQQCETNRLADVNIPAKISINGLDKCYDLENYKGKVSNIPSSTGFLTTDLNNAEIAKGATTIPFFNGSYGNFANNFFDKKKLDGNNYVYSVGSPLFFTSSGRLKFFVLDDNNDFNDSNGAIQDLTSSSSNGGSYNEQNGFKISTSSMLNYSNGQWLQVALCQETSNSNDQPSTHCKESGEIGTIVFTNNPEPPSTQEANIVKIDDTTSTPTSQKNHADSKYKFDDFGNLVRTGAAVSGDCNLANHGVDTLAGNYFYCHTYQYHTVADFDELSDSEKDDVQSNIEKLRLAFRIYDPEIPNCVISTGSRSTGTFDGIIADNNYYNSAESANVNAVCSETEIPGLGSGECTKEFICINKYNNNSGSYLVNIKVRSEVTSGVSNIIGEVVEPIIKVMDGPKRNCNTSSNSSNALFYDGYRKDPADTCEIADVGQAERIYKLLINDSRYKLILNTAIVLMFTFFGMTYLMGVSELSQTEIIGRVMKIGLIYLFVSPTGWDWFNSLFVRFFKGGSDHLAFLMASSFDSSPELQNAISNSDYYDKSILFGSVDRVFGILFSDAVLKKMYALIFASIFGWAYFLIVIMSFVLYILAVSNAVLLYLTAQIFMSILFTLGPIFFIFILFNQTKEMFDNWLKQLIGFSLQQILILTTLAFFNMLMYEVIKMALGYKICWDEVWTINIITRISLLSAWTIASLPPASNSQLEVGNIGNPDGIPSIFTILFIWVIASLMNKFISFMSTVAADISGGVSASSLGSGVTSAIKQAKELAQKGASKAWKKVGGEEAIQRMDMALFDSGKLAEERRDKANKANKTTSKRKATLEKAGKNAVEKFKNKNASKLNAMSDTERQETLNQVRKEAISAKGSNMGLSDKEMKELNESSGFQKYHGSNVFGAVAQAGRQAIGGKISGDSTISKSMGEKEADTSYTAKSFKKAAENMTKEQREDVAKDFNLDIKRSAGGKALRAMKLAKTGASNAGSVAKENIGQAGSTLKKAITGTKEERAEARGAMKSVIKSSAKKAGNAVAGAAKSAAMAATQGMREESEAIKQLEEEGDITKMRAGTNMARPKAENDKIKARIAQNRKQSNPGKTKDIGGAMDAKLELEHLNEMEEAQEKDTFFGRAAARRASKNKRSDSKNPRKDELREESEQKHNADVDTQIAGPKDDNGNRSGGLRADIKKSEKAKETAENTVSEAKKTKAAKIQQRDKLKAEGTEVNNSEAIAELDEDIQKQDEIIDTNSASALRSGVEIKNAKQKIDKLIASKFGEKKGPAEQVDVTVSEQEVEISQAPEEEPENVELPEEPRPTEPVTNNKVDHANAGQKLQSELKGAKNKAKGSLAYRLEAKKAAKAAKQEEEKNNNPVVEDNNSTNDEETAPIQERPDAVQETASAVSKNSIAEGISNAIGKIGATSTKPKNTTDENTDDKDKGNNQTPDSSDNNSEDPKQEENEPTQERQNAIKTSAASYTASIMASGMVSNISQRISAASKSAGESIKKEESEKDQSDETTNTLPDRDTTPNDGTDSNSDNQDNNDQDIDSEETSSDDNSTQENRSNPTEQLSRVKEQFSDTSNSLKNTAATTASEQSKSASKEKASSSLKSRLAARKAASQEIMTSRSADDASPKEDKNDHETIERSSSASAELPTQPPIAEKEETTSSQGSLDTDQEPIKENTRSTRPAKDKKKVSRAKGSGGVYNHIVPKAKGTTKTNTPTKPKPKGS